MNPIRLLDDTDTTIAVLFETQTESRTPVEILTDKTSGMTIAQIWETYKIDLMTAGIILILGYFLIRLIMRLVERHLRESKMERSAFTIITTVTKFLLYLILTLTAISKLGVPITSTLALFSTLALAITLAIKDGLTHLAGGIILLTSKPFVIGDHIECLADGATGYVTDIGPIHTKLRTPDGSKVYIPNGNLVASTVINHSGMGCRRIREISPSTTRRILKRPSGSSATSSPPIRRSIRSPSPFAASINSAPAPSTSSRRPTPAGRTTTRRASTCSSRSKRASIRRASVFPPPCGRGFPRPKKGFLGIFFGAAAGRDCPESAYGFAQKRRPGPGFIKSRFLQILNEIRM